MLKGNKRHSRLSFSLMGCHHSSSSFTYPKWQDDWKQAEQFRQTHQSQKLQQIKKSMIKRQRLHTGDRSDRLLRALDKQTFTYPNAKADIQHVEDYYVNEPMLVPAKLEQMKKQQKIHDGHRDHPQL